jgi:hypothetical protein
MFVLGVAYPTYYEQTSNMISIANVNSIGDIHDFSLFLSAPAFRPLLVTVLTYFTEDFLPL